MGVHARRHGSCAPSPRDGFRNAACVVHWPCACLVRRWWLTHGMPGGCESGTLRSALPAFLFVYLHVFFSSFPLRPTPRQPRAAAGCIRGPGANACVVPAVACGKPCLYCAAVVPYAPPLALSLPLRCLLCTVPSSSFFLFLRQ
ncbi:uncharacterized protein Tco025E_09334 [Trypanosoma conorhini]|uniref:Uncharacterized protein n=1 Tax=Trypanosoma conorhini TaxID=83891 RepID=A0A422MXZ5_9TRYP|nr:uncharacterized protein Tco025E_09334 [Trypanosoma conorhini]RNE98083.1 hypothetical protein Tco025E_09334 [Trypanosoma conorhini]